MAQHDPNHPPDLAIKPSARSGSSRGQEGGGQEWQTDSVDTIREFGIAGRVWEAAYLFVKYLQPPRWTDDCLGDDDDVTFDFDPPCPLFTPSSSSSSDLLTVLELGSGVGVVGLTCARELHQQRQRRQARPLAHEDEADTVILTDLENVVDLMTRNARLAGVPGVQVRALPWGSRQHARAILDEIAGREQPRRRLDYIICSDLVYFTELLAPLLRSLLVLTDSTSGGQDDSSGDAVPPPVLIAYKIRSMTKELPFWTALGRWFDVEVVHCRRRRRARRKGSGEETGEEKNEKEEEPRPSEEWHRFGSLQGDLAREGEHDAVDADEMSDDAYFVLIAHRKASTQGWSTPDDDAELMAGWMRRGEERKMGTGGADWLEWCLMSAMG